LSVNWQLFRASTLPFQPPAHTQLHAYRSGMFACSIHPLFWRATVAVKPIPDGYHSITPYLIVKGAAAALDFYKKAFGAQELFRFPGPDGKVMHAEFKIGNSPLMMSDEWPEHGFTGPLTRGGTTVSILIYTENVDAFLDRAITAAVKVLKPLQNQFYGDRSATVADPFGHVWTVATHIEDVSSEELQKRMAAMQKGGSCG
jgi:PhnB protein